MAGQGRTINEGLGHLAEAVVLHLDEVDDPQRHVTAVPLVTAFQIFRRGVSRRFLTYHFRKIATVESLRLAPRLRRTATLSTGILMAAPFDLLFGMR